MLVQSCAAGLECVDVCVWMFRSFSPQFLMRSSSIRSFSHWRPAPERPSHLMLHRHGTFRGIIMESVTGLDWVFGLQGRSP